MSPQTTHPLVTRYLTELDALLHGIDPLERAEVVMGVHEHVESALEGTARTDTDVRAALAEVGPATAVAEEAYAGRPVPASSPQPATARPWLPTTVAVLQGLALALVLLTYGTLGAFVSTSTSSSDGDFVVTDRDYVGSVFDAVALMVAAFPFWVLAVVLVAVAALWSGREKAVLMVLVPGCAVLLSGLPPLGYALVGEIGVYAGAGVAVVVALGGGATVLTVLVRRALRRSRGVAADS